MWMEQKIKRFSYKNQKKMGSDFSFENFRPRLPEYNPCSFEEYDPFEESNDQQNLKKNIILFLLQNQTTTNKTLLKMHDSTTQLNPNQIATLKKAYATKQKTMRIEQYRENLNTTIKQWKRLQKNTKLWFLRLATIAIVLFLIIVGIVLITVLICKWKEKFGSRQQKNKCKFCGKCNKKKCKNCHKQIIEKN